MSAGSAKPLGSRGEVLARRFLKRLGHKILAANYRCPTGEVDLISLDTDGIGTICFVEVKTRSDDQFTDPEAAVDADKRRRIRKVAARYLAERDTEEYDVRFDIVSIVLRDGSRPQVKHIPDAF